MKKIFFILLALVLALSLSIVGCTTPAEEEEEEEEPQVIVLKCGSIFPENHCIAQADLAWQQKITEDTDGVVQWENYFGTLLTFSDIYEEIQAGLVDVAQFHSLYETAGFPIGKRLPQFFIGLQTYEQIVEVATAVRQEFPEIDAEASGVKLVSQGNLGTFMNLMTVDVPIDSVDALQGLQLKCTAGTLDALNELGAIGVPMSATDVYQSLETGILDGALMATDTIKSLNLADMIHYFTTVNLCTGLYLGHGMNWDTWNSLPADIQQVFEDNKDFWTNALISHITAEEQAVLSGDYPDIQWLELDEDDLETFNEAFKQVAIESAQELDDLGFPGTEIYEEVQSLVSQY